MFYALRLGNHLHHIYAPLIGAKSSVPSYFMPYPRKYSQSEHANSHLYFLGKHIRFKVTRGIFLVHGKPLESVA